MASNGLLVLSNAKNLQRSLTAVQNYISNLYIHLPAELNTSPPPRWSKIISRIYVDSFQSHPKINVRVLVNPLKGALNGSIADRIDMMFSDGRNLDLCESLRKKYNIPSNIIYLSDGEQEILVPGADGGDEKVYNTVVLGGTFDRIHLGHKILLTEAVLRACKKVVVGVTDADMIKSKKLPELVLPVEQRIQDVRQFLLEIDPSLEYEIVPIADPFGPTKSDPDMDMIIVSAETLRGGEKVNELRAKNGLKQLEVHCIDLVEDAQGEGPKETKVSSSNARMDLLGTRLKAPEPRPNLPKRPYIIGLTGGIASGKSRMAERFRALGAQVLDCDKIAHEIYEPGQVCYQKVVDAFGREILGEDGRIDRSKLGPIVFSDAAKLGALNRLVWPELWLEAMRRVDTESSVVILEAAVLLKAGWEANCHEVWCMIVSPDEAVRRVVQRNGISPEDARKRLANQLDNKTMVEKSNVVFSSEWSTEYTQCQAEKAWHMLQDELRLS